MRNNLRIILMLMFLISLNIAESALLRVLAEDNNCFEIPEKSDGSNFSIAIKSSQWWSTTTLTFNIKNKCSTPQFMNNLVIVIEGWKINGDLVTKGLSTQQSGQPWLTITDPKYEKEKVSIVINTPKCEGEWCDWAKVPANSDHIISVTASIGTSVVSSTASSVYIDGAEPLNGNLIISLDSSKLIPISNSNTKIMINIINISNQQTFATFNTFPKLNQGKDSKYFKDITPGSYRITVDENTLPSAPDGKISVSIQPAENIIVSYGQTINSSIVFDYKKNISKGNLAIMLKNFPQSFEQQIKGFLINSENGTKKRLYFSSQQNTIGIPDLPVGSGYTIQLPGIAIPLAGEYFDKLNVQNIEVKENTTIKQVIEYSPNAESREVKFKFSGYEGDIVINFLPSNSDYIYKDATLTIKEGMNQTFYFLNTQIVTIKPQGVSGYSAKVTPQTLQPTDNAVNIVYSKASSNALIGGYYQSWSANWSSSGDLLSLANLPSYIARVLISFADPNMKYAQGSNSFSGTGLQFSSDFSVVKEAIKIAHEKNPDQKFLLSIGGATYPFSNVNYKGVVALMNDLGLDGVDIDYENSPSCTGVDTEKLLCSTDSSIITIINSFKSLMPEGKLLTAAVFSVGAYGTIKFPTSKFAPASSHSGMWVNPLLNAGNKLDEIFVMSYDASPAYNPNDAFDAYKSIFSGKIHLGLEVPPEAWGGYVLTVDDALKFANHVKDNAGAGVFIWSLQKGSQGKNADTYLKPICQLYGLSDCDKEIPKN